MHEIARRKRNEPAGRPLGKIGQFTHIYADNINKDGKKMDCEFIDDCRNANNDIKCGKCEHNPNNWNKIEKDDNAPTTYKPSGKKFYIFRDNYEPI